jgi:nitroimidazol reductase NimA-like FMN-containing flavoprotein (pyridoxamine 5'-phosphate oxidase superfamily)
MNATIDTRFSDPAAEATPWAETEQALTKAELYWLTTIRADGRPHVTPLIGVYADGAVHFCTGPEEQKARNLEHEDRIAVTTGNNTWAEGLDVVVEGRAQRVSDDATLQRLADAYEAKYGSFWHSTSSTACSAAAPTTPPCSGSSRPRSSPSPSSPTARPRTRCAKSTREVAVQSPQAETWTTTRSSFSANPSPRS